jgi:ABC-type Zn uptake system ZnuABC Zn-binding protein ZnuA
VARIHACLGVCGALRVFPLKTATIIAGDLGTASGEASRLLLRRMTAGALAAAVLCASVVACGTGAGEVGGQAGGPPQVLADTSFLADITQNVAGERLSVSSLVPMGADPHSFDPVPQDAQRVARCKVMVINVTGLIPVVDELIAGAGSADLLVIVASAGLPGVDEDPHYWLDPLSVVTYAENIADGLALVDPAGAAAYEADASSYSEALRELDAWIVAQVETIPAERRLLVTNHKSFGRFAARYGFDIVGRQSLRAATRRSGGQHPSDGCAGGLPRDGEQRRPRRAGG